MLAPATETEALAQDLERILSGAAPFSFAYQPIADLQRGTTAGYEALVRFPTRSGSGPDTCFRAAGTMGRRHDLELMVAAHCLSATRLLPVNCFLTVNVSPAVLVSDAWQDLLRRQEGLDRIVVEITEEESIVDYAEVRAQITKLRSRGASVAIDDAGAGYASLKHVVELRPNFIKLDRALVSDCDQDRAKSVLIEMIGAAADRMDAWIIAEGVETAGELAELLRLKVPLAQGYYLGMPLKTMCDLLPTARTMVRENAVRRRASSELLLISEPCLTAATPAEAEKLLKGRAGRLVAVLDTWRRPVMLLDEPGGCTRIQYEFYAVPGDRGPARGPDARTHPHRDASF